ncbi:transcriptional regulator [Opitutaceae bacterium TAV1]|nr:transcriptional regulator [Opitutaceae bacterium TAV1]
MKRIPNAVPKRTPTQADVARAAGVTATTVSWALRNDPRITAETQSRVWKAARALGYRPDPMLSALVARRDRGARRRSAANLLALVDDRWQATRMTVWHQSFIDGMEAACERFGYSLDVLHIFRDIGSHREPDRMLHARSIRGIVLLPLYSHEVSLKLQWDRYSVVAVGNLPESLPFHRVGSDAFDAIQVVCDRLYQLGYRRIGLAHSGVAEKRLRYEWLGAILKEAHIDPPRFDIVPPHIPFDFSEETFREWVVRHRPEAVISNHPPVIEWLGTAGIKVPEDIGVALLSRDSTDTPAGGISQHLDLAGDTAVEQLHTLLLRGERGFPSMPKEILIRPHWADGPTLKNMDELFHKKLRE